MQYYSIIKENEIMSFAARWMDLEIIILNEVNQMTNIISLIYIILKKMIHMNIFTKHTCRLQFSSVQFRHSVVSDSLQPHESQHARPPCPSPTPGVYSDSCPSSQ